MNQRKVHLGKHIAHLVCAPSRNKDAVAWPLINTEALDTCLVVQSLAQRNIKVKLLDVNGIMGFEEGRRLLDRLGLICRLLHLLLLILAPRAKLLLEERPQVVTVLRAVYIPDSVSFGPIRAFLCVQHNIQRVRHIHMQSCRALRTLLLTRCHRVIHFGACIRQVMRSYTNNTQIDRRTKVWADRICREMGTNVVDTITSHVVRNGHCLTKVFKKLGKGSFKVGSGRPVLPIVRFVIPDDMHREDIL